VTEALSVGLGRPLRKGDELRKIAEADDLHISPFREDGKTYGMPTWIWSVAVERLSTFVVTTGRSLVGTRRQ
jgi:hypothetical protein